MLKNFLNSIVSIFFDIPLDQKNKDIFSFQDLTGHFKDEIEELYLDAIYIGANYRNISSDLEAYKYRSNRDYTSTYVDILAKIVEESRLLDTNENIGIVPVPMHWSRYFIRGFNHINRIGVLLSEKLYIDYCPIIGAHYTKRQSKLSKKQRLKNRNNSFFYRKKWCYQNQ